MRLARTRYESSDAAVPFRALPAAALRAVFREGYSGADLKRDVAAGIVVGIVALPLAMALAIAVGVPPQHGLYTAIVAGVVVAGLGGSRTQVTGPTAAFVVILAPIFTEFGMAGLLISGCLAGLILIAMGVARLGRLVKFIPHPVTTGFTAGIATVIATMQVKDFFGLTPTGHPEQFLERVAAMFEARGTAQWWEPLIGAITLTILVGLPRLTRRMPAPLVALPVGALVALVLGALVPGCEPATIANRFHSTIGEVVVAGIPQQLPMPALPWLAAGANGQAFVLGFDTFRALFAGAFAIATLGAIESLLSAVVADGMAGTKHDPDAELLALGVGNVVAPFFGGIPATGAIARTATNVRTGARSPIAAIVHALTVLAAVLVLAPLLGFLPMAGLAALLLLVAWNMSEAKHFVHTLRIAPRGDVMVLLTCFVLTVCVDMVIGVSVGIVLAAFLFMGRMAAVTESRVVALGGRSDVPHPIPAGVLVYEISGPLFFGAAQKAMSALRIVSGETKVVVLLMDRVHALDVTGLVALESALASLRRRDCFAVLSGVLPQPRTLLLRAHVDTLEGVAICATAAEAMAFATTYLSDAAATP